MENKAGNTRRYESYSTDYFNKENRYDYILHIWLSNLICRRYKVALMHFEINVAACSSTIKTALISGFGMIYDYLFVKNKYYSWWCVWILPNWKKKRGREGRILLYVYLQVYFALWQSEHQWMLLNAFW